MKEEAEKKVSPEYLNPGLYVDSDHPAVTEFAIETTTGVSDDREKAIKLYYRIRDGWRYDPYQLDLSEEGLKASDLLKRDYGYCIEKANLLAASARAIGIPSRLGFANVKNHIGVEKYYEILGTDVLVFHGYVQLFLKKKWVTATPAFNKELCERFEVAPLEFDGEHDSIFQEYNHTGHKYMEYLHDYGTFADVPRDLFISELQKHYPKFFSSQQREAAGINVNL